MAVMLRTLGIPSRVVNGFRTGEFNDLTSQYVVRASNAHSWVEAYFPGLRLGGFRSHSGRIDADAYGLEPDIHVRRCHGLVLAGVDRQLRRGHQQALAVSAGSRSRYWFAALRHWWHRHYEVLLVAARHTGSAVAGSPLRWGLGGMLTAALLLFAVKLPRLLLALGKFQLAARPERSPRRAATIWYERMTDNVARRGWRKSPTQTPDEFVARIDDAGRPPEGRGIYPALRKRALR